MEKLLFELSQAKQICFDLETTGLDAHNDEIVSISFAIEEKKAWCIQMPCDIAKAKIFLQQFKSILENPITLKVGHNIKFDIKFLLEYGITVKGPLFDTQVAHYLIDPDNKKHGLKKISKELLNIDQTKFEDLFENKKKKYKSSDIREIPISKLSHYACQDVDITLRLKNHLTPILESKGLLKVFHDIEMPLVHVLASMELEGINLDTVFLKNLLMEITQEILEYETTLIRVAGKGINFNSPAQLSKLLFDHFEIHPIGIQLKSGQYSTSSKVLQHLKSQHPIIPTLIKYKEALKLKSTFIEKLPKYVNPITKRLHTNFNQTVTSTGRLSSSKPNLQNIPKKKDGVGSLIRKGIIPRRSDHILIAADFSQIELRVMAHFSNDPILISAYNDNIDIHRATAATMHNVSIDKIPAKDPRRGEAKSINFGLIYGMSSIGLAEKLTEQLEREVTESEANEKTETYFDKFKGVKTFIEDAIYIATCKGYTETLTGRKRFLPDLDSNIKSKRAAAQRNSVNAPIQGTAADLIKIAMINIHDEIVHHKLKSRMILQVHDELVFDVPIDEKNAMWEIIKIKMEAAMSLNVPLQVEIQSGQNWAEAH